MREREKHITEINMSANQHTEAVLLEWISYVPINRSTNKQNIVNEDIEDTSKIILSVAWMVHAIANYNKLDFRTELRRALLLEDFLEFIEGVRFPNGLEAAIDKLTDAIIKDMAIQAETKDERREARFN